jgi:aspartate carbamoyltransferase catalytic subunit
MPKLHHVLEAQEFDREALERIFDTADKMRGIVEQGGSDILKGKLLASLFYEPSTRTRFSFETAMLRLGGEVITTESAGQFSSTVKGETLEDTIKIVSSYADVIVLRHNEAGSAKLASGVSNVPVINAGDGTGQHPTQSLLDLYTIRDAFRIVDGLHIVIVGDLKYGRTARSLAYLLGKYRNISITFVAPAQLSMSDDIIEYCTRHGMRVTVTTELAPVLPHADCVYMTRIQKERMPTAEYEQVKGAFVLTIPLMQTMKEKAIILHPLPRVDEIPVAVDSDRRARYFEQARNGVFIRMALLRDVLLD